MTDIEELREYYNKTDMSASIRRAVREEEVVEQVMVSTSIRLSQSLMNRVRQRASDTGVTTATLIQQWVIERLKADPNEPAQLLSLPME
jgi:predicted DNA binding CopG/RHH family protein